MAMTQTLHSVYTKQEYLNFPSVVIEAPEGVYCEIIKTEDDILGLSAYGKYIVATEDILMEADKIILPGDCLIGVLTIPDTSMANVQEVINTSTTASHQGVRLVFNITDFYNVKEYDFPYHLRIGTISERMNKIKRMYTFSYIKGAVTHGTVYSKDTLDMMLEDIRCDNNPNLSGVLIVSAGAQCSPGRFNGGYWMYPLKEYMWAEIKVIFSKYNVCNEASCTIPDSDEPVTVDMRTAPRSIRNKLAMSPASEGYLRSHIWVSKSVYNDTTVYTYIGGLNG